MLLSSSLLFLFVFLLAHLGVIRFLRHRAWSRTQAQIRSFPRPLSLNHAHLILFDLHYKEFPLLSLKAMEFGLFKTYAVPGIAKVVAKTGELVDRTPKRYDDTDLLMREILEGGFGYGDILAEREDSEESKKSTMSTKINGNTKESPPSKGTSSFKLESRRADGRAETALKRVIALHKEYVGSDVGGPMFLYTLCIFMCEPFLWIDRFGYRPSTETEKHASHVFWTFVGREMEIRNIPADFDACLRFLLQYESTLNKSTSESRILGKASVQLFISVVPEFARPLAGKLVHAACDKRLRTVMGFPEPPRGLPKVVETLLWMHGTFVKWAMPPRRQPLCRIPRNPDRNSRQNLTRPVCPMNHPYEPVYQNGYIIDHLGPCKANETAPKRVM